MCRHSLKVKIRGDRERYEEELQQREMDDRRIEEILVICLTHTLSQRRITLSHTPATWFMGVPCIQRHLNSRPGSLALLISVCLCVCLYMSVSVFVLFVCGVCASGARIVRLTCSGSSIRCHKVRHLLFRSVQGSNPHYNPSCAFAEKIYTVYSNLTLDLLM